MVNIKNTVTCLRFYYIIIVIVLLITLIVFIGYIFSPSKNVIYNKKMINVFSCIDDAESNKEIDLCGEQIIQQFEIDIEKKYEILKDKYSKNRDMIALIELSKQSWTHYYNIHSNLEGAVAAKGQVKGILPVDAEKKFVKSVVRLLDNMNYSLEALL